MDAQARWQVLRLHVEDQVPLARLARETGVGLRTLERWKARYRAHGFAGLEPPPPRSTGGSTPARKRRSSRRSTACSPKE